VKVPEEVEYLGRDEVSYGYIYKQKKITLSPDSTSHFVDDGGGGDGGDDRSGSCSLSTWSDGRKDEREREVRMRKWDSYRHGKFDCPPKVTTHHISLPYVLGSEMLKFTSATDTSHRWTLIG
jgi:hypothetical protein